MLIPIAKCIIPALTASVVVSPISFAIDRAIIDHANFNTTIQAGIFQSLKPASIFSKNSALTYASYSFSFAVSNSIKSRFHKVALLSICSILFSMYRDTKMATYGSPTPVHKMAYASFIVRDIITIVSAFAFPSRLGVLCHMLFISILQIPCTYFHLIGIDYCSVNHDKNINRHKRIFKTLHKNIAVRNARTVFAYAVGGKLNVMMCGILGKL